MRSSRKVLLGLLLLGMAAGTGWLYMREPVRSDLAEFQRGKEVDAQAAYARITHHAPADDEDVERSQDVTMQGPLMISAAFARLP